MSTTEVLNALETIKAVYIEVNTMLDMVEVLTPQGAST